jgi:hypothetical protein
VPTKIRIEENIKNQLKPLLVGIFTLSPYRWESEMFSEPFLRHPESETRELVEIEALFSVEKKTKLENLQESFWVDPPPDLSGGGDKGSQHSKAPRREQSAKGATAREP